MMQETSEAAFSKIPPDIESDEPIQPDDAQKRLDPKNPFENELENRSYRLDYRRILPQVLVPGFSVRQIPEKMERRGIRKCFNAAGLGVFISTLAQQLLFTILLYVVLAAMGVTIWDYTTDDSVSEYLNHTSIFIGLNAIVCVSVNYLTAYFGCHSIRVPIRSLFQTERLKIRDILRYLCIAIGLQYVASLLYTYVSDFFASNGVELAEVDFSYFQTGKSTITVLLYTCVLAPITEELLYRGFIQKALSCVSTRFGIVASALIFGLAHGNVEQFLLAFLVGIFFGKIVERHNSLVPSICVHMGINTISLIFSLVSEKMTSSVGDVVLGLLDFGYLILVIVGILFWIWQERKKPLPYPMQKQAIRNRVAASSPWLIAAIVVQIAVMIYNNVAS